MQNGIGSLDNRTVPERVNLIDTDKVLTWHLKHGRHNLPWQKDQNAYRVWISEIMLQQTQVKKVVGYFTRFMQEFPTLEMLALANQDQVLKLWAGLGYYSRARNLHRAAQQAWSQWQSLPTDEELLQSLPGIGRSTAAAIISLAYNQPATIMDANVRRVLSRYYLIDGYPQKAAVQKKLWKVAIDSTPNHSARNYTQAMMDLGASVCKPRAQADCEVCPICDGCEALKQDKVSVLPASKPAANKPLRSKVYWILYNEHKHVLLVKRPPTGVWGGLWCLPEKQDVPSDMSALEENDVSYVQTLRHTFSHFVLDMNVHSAHMLMRDKVCDSALYCWVDSNDPKSWPGVPAPIMKILR